MIWKNSSRCVTGRRPLIHALAEIDDHHDGRVGAGQQQKLRKGPMMKSGVAHQEACEAEPRRAADVDDKERDHEEEER